MCTKIIYYFFFYLGVMSDIRIYGEAIPIYLVYEIYFYEIGKQLLFFIFFVILTKLITLKFIK